MQPDKPDGWVPDALPLHPELEDYLNSTVSTAVGRVMVRDLPGYISMLEEELALALERWDEQTNKATWDRFRPWADTHDPRKDRATSRKAT